MGGLLDYAMSRWLQVEKLDEPGLYKTVFNEQHLGNIYIRSLHGGVSGSLIEVCAEAETRSQLKEDAVDLSIISTSVNYLRITKDQDLFCRVNIVRMSRRLSVLSASCWQDSEDVPVVRGTVTIKLESLESQSV